MVDLDRHRVDWTGFLGGPGISTFFCAAGTAMNSHLNSFFTSLAAYLPSDVNIQIEPNGDTIDSATGLITAAWADTPEALLTGTATGGYSAVSGALVQWGSATYLSGRRLRGHTFIVPINDTAYDNTGVISAAYVTGLTSAAAALVSSMAGNMMIWQRPRVAAPAYTDRRGVVHPAITARIGGYGPVTTGKGRPKVTELRSRRD